MLAPEDVEAISNYLMSAQYAALYTPLEVYAMHVEFAARFEAPLRGICPEPMKPWDPLRQIRVGFVSGDLHNHPVGFFLEGVLANLERQRIAITLYPTYLKEDDLARRLQRQGHAWQPLLGLNDEQAAQRIRADGIDILIDLSGHTAHNRLRLFARKPAPIQVTWLGYFATTGLQNMDYILGDRYVIPEQEKGYYSETPWILPDSYLCFTPPHEDILVGPAPAQRNGYITFGCCNNLTKMGAPVVAAWSRILNAVPNARLLLKTKQLNDLALQQATRERFAAHGIDSERLILEGAAPRAELLASYKRIDIALDPFPYPGGTTTLEALWMGVPVLNLKGDRFLSHVGESILQTTGLGEWIADDEDDYVAKAVANAGNLEYLGALRQELRQRLIDSPLCDAPRFARNLENAFREMWQQHCSQLQEVQI